MQCICEPRGVNPHDKVRRLAGEMARRYRPYLSNDEMEFTREVFAMLASQRHSATEAESKPIFDEVYDRTLASRRMLFDLSRPAADRASLWSVKSLCGDVSAAWSTWAITSPWWPASLVCVKTPELFDPPVIANHVVEGTGLYIPKDSFKRWWPQLMACVEINGASE